MDDIVKTFLEFSLSLGILVLALKWLNKDRSDVLTALYAERAERIKVLERHAEDCAADRIELRKELNGLQLEVRSLLFRLVDKNVLTSPTPPAPSSPPPNS